MLENYLTGPGAADLEDPDGSEPGLESFADVEAVAKRSQPHAAIAKMREQGGGLKLAYKMMSLGLWNMAAVIYMVMQPLWDWYTAQVTGVKTPVDALRYNIQMAAGWPNEPHLRHLLRHCFERPASLRECYIDGMRPSEQRKLIQLVSDLAWSMLSERVLIARNGISTPDIDLPCSPLPYIL